MDDHPIGDEHLIPPREWLRSVHATWTKRATEARTAYVQAVNTAEAYEQLFALHYPGEALGTAEPPIMMPRRISDPQTIADAAEKVLNARGVAMNVAEILSGVQELGFLKEAVNRNSALSSVTSAVMRDRKQRFIRAEDGRNCWVLAAWRGDRKT